MLWEWPGNLLWLSHGPTELEPATQHWLQWSCWQWVWLCDWGFPTTAMQHNLCYGFPECIKVIATSKEVPYIMVVIAPTLSVKSTEQLPVNTFPRICDATNIRLLTIDIVRTMCQQRPAICIDYYYKCEDYSDAILQNCCRNTVDE